jgi:hypothetical protein
MEYYYKESEFRGIIIHLNSNNLTKNACKARKNIPRGGNEGTTVMFKACWLIYQYPRQF